MENGMDTGIILLLGVVISGIVIAINGVVEMLGQMFGQWVKVKGPKGWVNFVTGFIVAFLALIGMCAWG